MATKRKKRVQDLPVLHPDAAGIDVGASEIFVAVPADRDAERATGAAGQDRKERQSEMILSAGRMTATARDDIGAQY